MPIEYAPQPEAHLAAPSEIIEKEIPLPLPVAIETQ
jgi:hypothetical protein